MMYDLNVFNDFKLCYYDAGIYCRLQIKFKKLYLNLLQFVTGTLNVRLLIKG